MLTYRGVFRIVNRRGRYGQQTLLKLRNRTLQQTRCVRHLRRASLHPAPLNYRLFLRLMQGVPRTPTQLHLMPLAQTKSAETRTQALPTSHLQPHPSRFSAGPQHHSLVKCTQRYKQAMGGVLVQGLNRRRPAHFTTVPLRRRGWYGHSRRNVPLCRTIPVYIPRLAHGNKLYLRLTTADTQPERRRL